MVGCKTRTNELEFTRMSSPELSARLRFLNDSAHLLVTAAPSTSRHLRSRCDALMSENELAPSETYKRDACGACGTIAILGWEGAIHTESQSSQQKKIRLNGQPAKQTKTMIYQCKTCGRKTRLPLGTPSSATRRKPISSEPRLLPTSHSLTTSTPSSSVSEIKSNSKKRAKARKRGGLEALLAARKPDSAASGFGLDLMDFMKKS
jgi:RNase P subunit RPR2